MVRDVTKDIFGVEKFTFLTGGEPTVVMSTFKPGDPNNAFAFNPAAPGPAVILRVFAAKIGHTERTHWLMLPFNNRATSRSSMALLMPVRSAGGGGELGRFISQSGLGYKIVSSI